MCRLIFVYRESEKEGNMVKNMRSRNLCAETDAAFAVMRASIEHVLWDGNGVLERWVDKVIVERIFAPVEIPKTPTDNVETEAVEMHRMICSCNYTGPLEDKLHCSPIFEHLNFSSIGGKLVFKRQIVCRVVESQRWEVREVVLVNSIYPIVVSL